MKVISLQSGSNGNCIYVEAGGRRLLLDAGISGLQAERRLAARGIDIRRCDGVFISHDHRDHIRCAGVYQRKFKLPIYCTVATLETASRCLDLGELCDVRGFVSGSTMDLGGLRVETIRTPHDAADGVGFVLDDGRHRLGVLTDLGHVFAALPGVVASLDAVLIESNYDPHLLETGPYPYPLKQRISGPHGHLSNAEASELVRAAGRKLRWVCLGHLSEDNNNPQLALTTAREILGNKLPIQVATRYEATEVMAV